MDFGEYGSVRETVYNFQRAPKWAWRIKTATFKQEREHDKLFSFYTVKYNADGTRERLVSTTDALFAAEEIWLTFGGTNIPANTSDEPVEIDKINLNTKGLLFPLRVMEDKERFMEILGGLPTEMIMELWVAVRRANPQWSPGFQPESSSTTSSDE